MFDIITPEEQTLTKRQCEAGELYYDALDGNRRAQRQFAEALAYSDLPIQLQPTLEADFLADWEKRAPVSHRFTKTQIIDRVNQNVEYWDFRIAGEIPDENNGERFIGGLPKKLPEQPAPKLSFAGSNKFLRTSVRELGLDIQWETIYNSRGARVDLIKEAFEEFASRAEDSDEVAAVKLLLTSSGINTGVLGTTGHVAVSGATTNPALTPTTAVQALADAIAQANTHVVNGKQVNFTKFALVVNPALVPMIKQALTGMSLTYVPGSSGGVQLQQQVDLGADLDVVGFSWLKTAFSGSDKYWFLIPIDGRRKGLVRVKAAGEEDPSFWIKSTGGFIYPNGGDIPVLDGQFTNETYEAKTRYVVDGGVVDNAGIIYSNGTNAA
ncbi:hypothetical protein [Agromyces sp. NPDC058104]|uniref:hypothetical protein n=1 Tax=Agromyces sp. NPDC058104 TaxID=3346342 RepID=UPI0036DA7436